MSRASYPAVKTLGSNFLVFGVPLVLGQICLVPRFLGVPVVHSSGLICGIQDALGWGGEAPMTSSGVLRRMIASLHSCTASHTVFSLSVLLQGQAHLQKDAVGGGTGAGDQIPSDGESDAARQ